MILCTGRGTSGSWSIRGQQLGKAIGATVIPHALDVAGYDLAIIVKRAPVDLLQRLRRADVPVVLDIVDGWPQPAGNLWGRDECMAWLRSEVKRIRPVGLVAATKAMARDCAEFGLPVLALPHHARPGQEVNPIREKVRTVGYEGATHYLGKWRAVLEAECARRGWEFHLKPVSLAELDIVVALREVDGYAPRHWKSGVKLANAMGSGTPLIGNREAGYAELAVGNCVKWADNDSELSAALDDLTPALERRRVGGWFFSAAPTLDVVAKTYRGWLRSLINECVNNRISAS